VIRAFLALTLRKAQGAQIGEMLNIPKQTVLNQLKPEGIRLGTNKGRLANPENYRLAYAPFGFAKKDGKRIPNKSELKICRLVIQLRNDSKMSFHEITRELERRRIKGRTNSISWTLFRLSRLDCKEGSAPFCEPDRPPQSLTQINHQEFFQHLFQRHYFGSRPKAKMSLNILYTLF